MPQQEINFISAITARRGMSINYNIMRPTTTMLYRSRSTPVQRNVLKVFVTCKELLKFTTQRKLI